MTAAADVYEIVVHNTAVAPSGLRRLLSQLFRAGPADSGGVIISIRHRETGDELFRHIEDGGDDEDHLLYGLKQDLASMTADEFMTSWGS